MEEEKKQEEVKELNDKIKESVSKKIEEILNAGVRQDNVDYLFKLEDIKKDVCNEKYWKEKIEIMRYRNSYRGGDGNEMYSNYGRRTRDSQGRYMDGDYGRRGVDSRYRDGAYGHMDDMQDSYDRYEGYRESYNRGNYGAKDESIKSLEDMLDSTYKLMQYVSKNADNEEEMQLIRHYAEKISQV